MVLAVSCACAPAHVPAPAAKPAARALTIAPLDADVWAWTADVEGAASPDSETCSLHVRGAPVDATKTGDVVRAHVALSAGENEVFLACVDRAGRVRRSPTAHLRGMLRDAPTARVDLARRDGQLVADAGRSEPSGGSRAPLARFSWSVAPPSAARVVGEGARVVIVPLAKDAPAVVRLEVTDARGATDVARVRAGGGRPASDEVVYGVVPPLFGTPPLAAVARAVPSLAELGVDVLWLSPIFETPPGDYGYAVTDYFRVRPDFGTAGDLERLVGDAHRRGLRVVLDLVPNHTSDRHPYFVDAAARGRASHYFGFYERGEDGAPTHYFDWVNLPNLAYEDAEVARWMLSATAHWMREAAVDGYRVDAAWGIERRTPSFWALFRDEARRVDPDALLLAEASARDPFWREHGFDAAYDWTDAPGHWAWEDVFRDPDEIADRLDAAVTAAPTHVLRFLENNDTGPRFVTRHGADLTRVAAGALLTLPGIPSLFTGQERGAEYEPYRRSEPLDTADPHELRPWYRALLALRRRVLALRERGYARARVDGPDRRTLAYARYDADARSVALVVLRFDARPARARVVLPAAAAGHRTWTDALGAAATAEAKGGALDLALDGWAVRALVAAD